MIGMLPDIGFGFLDDTWPGLWQWNQFVRWFNQF